MILCTFIFPFCFGLVEFLKSYTFSFGRYVGAGTLMNNYAHIFDLLTRLRQVPMVSFIWTVDKTAYPSFLVHALDGIGGPKSDPKILCNRTPPHQKKKYPMFPP